MGDNSSQQSPNQNYARSTVPSLFRDFTMKGLSGAEALRSPTSILDTRSALSPLGTEAISSPRIMQSENRSSCKDKVDDSNGIIGLALVGTLKDEPFHHNSAKLLSSRKVLFGTKLRLKIPPLLPPSPFESKTCAAADFGAKTNDSRNKGIYNAKDSPPAVANTGVLSLSEMELSEEYTCVISHGTNPRTTHIFDNCVVEGHFYVPNKYPQSPSGNFLNFCYTCKKHLEQTKDIFIYR